MYIKIYKIKITGTLIFLYDIVIFNFLYNIVIQTRLLLK